MVRTGTRSRTRRALRLVPAPRPSSMTALYLRLCVACLWRRQEAHHVCISLSPRLAFPPAVSPAAISPPSPSHPRLPWRRRGRGSLRWCPALGGHRHVHSVNSLWCRRRRRPSWLLLSSRSFRQEKRRWIHVICSARERIRAVTVVLVLLGYQYSCLVL